MQNSTHLPQLGLLRLVLLFQPPLPLLHTLHRMGSEAGAGQWRTDWQVPCATLQAEVWCGAADPAQWQPAQWLPFPQRSQPISSQPTKFTHLSAELLARRCRLASCGQACAQLLSQLALLILGRRQLAPQRRQAALVRGELQGGENRGAACVTGRCWKTTWVASGAAAGDLCHGLPLHGRQKAVKLAPHTTHLSLQALQALVHISHLALPLLHHRRHAGVQLRGLRQVCGFESGAAGAF